MNCSKDSLTKRKRQCAPLDRALLASCGISQPLPRPFPLASIYPFTFRSLHRLRPSFSPPLPRRTDSGDDGIPTQLYEKRIGRERADKKLNYIFSRALHLSDTGGAKFRSAPADLRRRSQGITANVRVLSQDDLIRIKRSIIFAYCIILA